MNDERTQWLQREPQTDLAKKLGIAAWIFSAIVMILVVGMRELRLPMPFGISTDLLPPFHAFLNTLVSILLVASLIAIKLGKISLHRALMLGAMLLSVIFLLSSVIYHITTDPTRFGGSGTIRTVYFILLITHIVAAAVSLPFILFTFIAAWTNHFDKHRKLARWVFPLWLYVAVTGPVCYWMLKPYY